MARDSDSESIWQELEAGIHDVYDHRSMTPKRFMELYSHVYNFCTNMVTDRGGSGTKVVRTGKIRRKPGNGVGANVKGSAVNVGHDLYNRIRDFLRIYLTALTKEGAEKMGEDLLSFYQAQWEHFTFSSKVMNGFCAYLNRYANDHWVRSEHDEGKENIFQVYQLCLEMWKETLFRELQTNATSTLLALIQSHRNGNTVNDRLIREVIASYVELGSENDSSNSNQNGKLGIYQHKFEDAFLQETENYYTTEAALFIQDHSVTEYLLKVEQRLMDEEKRVDLYLHSSTLPSLRMTCESILIRNQLEAIHAEFPILLKNDLKDDLRRLYSLVSRLDNAFGSMKDILEDHISQEGTTAIQSQGESCLNDPKLFIATIIGVHTQYKDLVSTSFNSDSGFMAALDKACGRYINSNFITKAANTSQKSPEILARYCDMVLRKSGRNLADDEMESALNEAMIVFKYIDDKDVFQKFYSKTLANRLVLGLSASDDAESSMITKLKQACGFEYISKLQRMFQDIGLSKDMNEAYKRWIGEQELPNPPSIDMNVLVLSTGSWPFTQSVEFSLPEEFGPSIQTFLQYYNVMHTGRKLTWLYNRSTAEVVANHYSKRYTFVASTFQTSILLMYNSNDSYTLQELMQATGLKMDIMTQIIQIFLRTKLLETDQDQDKLTADTRIKLFKEYKNKKTRININIPLRIDTKAEDLKTQTSVEEDRKWECQCAIVRIMKSRKSMEHQLLVASVLEMLSVRFKPSVGLVKKCIETLLEKDYIVRSEDSKDTYNYVA